MNTCWMIDLPLALVCASAITAPARSDDARPPRRVVVIAHRGAHRDCPENTLPAIARAIELGCDYVELDVRQTRDGALVLIHDATVERTTNGRGNVAELTLAEIRALEVRAPRDRFVESVRVPTLDEALGACADKIDLYLDHKQAPEDLTVETLRRHGMTRRTAVYSSVTELVRFREYSADVRLMSPHPEDEDQMRRWHATPGVSVFDGVVEEWTASLVEAAHRLGAQVWVDCLGDQDQPQGWRRAVELGVDGIQSDRPGELIRVLDDQGLR